MLVLRGQTTREREKSVSPSYHSTKQSLKGFSSPKEPASVLSGFSMAEKLPRLGSLLPVQSRMSPETIPVVDRAVKVQRTYGDPKGLPRQEIKRSAIRLQ